MDKKLEERIKKFNDSLLSDFEDFDADEIFNTGKYIVSLRQNRKEKAHLVYGDDVLQLHVYSKDVAERLKKYKKRWEEEFNTPAVMLELYK